MIGKETGFVLNFATRSKTCHICTVHQNKNHTVPAHDCSKNYDGTSKGIILLMYTYAFIGSLSLLLKHQVKKL